MEGKEAAARVSRIAFASQSLFSKDAADTNINACILQCQAISLKNDNDFLCKQGNINFVLQH